VPKRSAETSLWNGPPELTSFLKASAKPKKFGNSVYRFTLFQLSTSRSGHIRPCKILTTQYPLSSTNLIPTATDVNRVLKKTHGLECSFLCYCCMYFST